MYNLEFDPSVSHMPFLLKGFPSALQPQPQLASQGAAVSTAPQMPVLPSNQPVAEAVEVLPDGKAKSHMLFYCMVGVVGAGIIIYLMTAKKEEVRQQEALCKLEALKPQTKQNLQRTDALQQRTGGTLCFRDLHL